MRNPLLPGDTRGSGVVTAAIMWFTLMVYNYGQINYLQQQSGFTMKLQTIRALVLNTTMLLSSSINTITLPLQRLYHWV